MSEHEVPRGLRAGGRRLWLAVTGEYELAEAEVLLLELACRTRDRINSLERVIARDGALGFGEKISAAVVEIRQQQQLLARLVVAMRMPDDSDERPQFRSMRGLYRHNRQRLIAAQRARQLEVVHK